MHLRTVGEVYGAPVSLDAFTKARFFAMSTIWTATLICSAQNEDKSLVSEVP